MCVSTTLFGTDAKRVAGTCPDCGQDDLFEFSVMRMDDDGVSVYGHYRIGMCKTKPVRNTDA